MLGAVDWFGSATFAEGYRRTSQPMIEIQVYWIPDILPHIGELFTLINGLWPKKKRARLSVGCPFQINIELPM
ncbi:MAG: hypothetical protein Q7R66_14960 [Undibacterium sp.]|nr:hypothetical protein [Undibacterium sp.]